MQNIFASCVTECKDGDEIPVENGDFNVEDNDENTPDDPKTVFTPGEKTPDYTIIIKPKDGPNNDPLNPMSITGPTGDNVDEVVVTVYPEDGSDPTEIKV